MKIISKKNKYLQFLIAIIVCFIFIQNSKVFAAAFCITDPWLPMGEDNRCPVTAVVTIATNPVSSGSNTDITVDGRTLWQWNVNGFGEYAITLTNAGGIVVNDWLFSGGMDFPNAGGPITVNSGALTGPVTVEFCATSDQLVTTCDTATITVQAAAPSVNIFFSLFDRAQIFLDKLITRV